MNTTQQNVPVLRFKNERGENYPDWEKKKLGNIGRIIGGGTPNTRIEKYWKGSIPWISSSDIDADDINTIREHRYITKEAIRNSATKIVPKNSILFISRVGIGKLVIARSEVCTSQDFTNLILKNDISIFVGYLFQLKKNYLLRCSQGTSIKGFTSKDLKTLEASLPVVEEQQKIAAFLSSVDTKIDQLNQKKALLEQYKKGLMQKLFSQEIRFKDEQGEEYPDWEDKRLGEFYDITSSKRVFQSEWKDSGIPFYRAREIIELSKNGKVDNDLFISPDMYKKYSEKYGAPKENDLLVTGVGTIGKLYVVPRNSNFYFKDGNIIWFKNKNQVSSLFIKYLFQTRYIKKQLLDNASITTVATYTIESANKTKVLIPTIEEQQKIANFLSAIDQKIELVSEQLKQAQTFKKGLLQQMFI